MTSATLHSLSSLPGASAQQTGTPRDLTRTTRRPRALLLRILDAVTEANRRRAEREIARALCRPGVGAFRQPER